MLTQIGFKHALWKESLEPGRLILEVDHVGLGEGGGLPENCTCFLNLAKQGNLVS